MGGVGGVGVSSAAAPHLPTSRARPPARPPSKHVLHMRRAVRREELTPLHIDLEVWPQALLDQLGKLLGVGVVG